MARQQEISGNIKGLAGVKVDLLISDTQVRIESTHSNKQGVWRFTNPDTNVYDILFSGRNTNETDNIYRFDYVNVRDTQEFEGIIKDVIVDDSGTGKIKDAAIVQGKADDMGSIHDKSKNSDSDLSSLATGTPGARSSVKSGKVYSDDGITQALGSDGDLKVSAGGRDVAVIADTVTSGGDVKGSLLATDLTVLVDKSTKKVTTDLLTDTGAGLSVNADDGKTGFDETVQFRGGVIPTNTPGHDLETSFINDDGSAQHLFGWSYSQGANRAHGFIVRWAQGKTSGQTISSVTSSRKLDSATRAFTIVIPRNNYITFEISAYYTSKDETVETTSISDPNWTDQRASSTMELVGNTKGDLLATDSTVLVSGGTKQITTSLLTATGEDLSSEVDNAKFDLDGIVQSPGSGDSLLNTSARVNGQADTLNTATTNAENAEDDLTRLAAGAAGLRTSLKSSKLYNDVGTIQLLNSAGEQESGMKSRLLLRQGFAASTSLASIDATTPISKSTFMNGVDGSINQGDHMDRPGVVTGISIRTIVTLAIAGSPTFKVTVRPLKNNVSTGITMEAIIAPVASGEDGAYSIANPFTFVAGDRLRLVVDLEIVGGNVGDSIAIANTTVMLDVIM